jgi:cytidylate kinase
MSRSPFIIVAIDGGAASGKSSTSRTLSQRFNFLHADTGSYYRALTAELLRRNVSAQDLGAIKTALADVKLSTQVTGRSAAMELSGHVIPDA